MKNSDGLVFVGLLVGSFILILITGWITNPNFILVSAQSGSQNPDALNAVDCTLPASYAQAVRQWCAQIMNAANAQGIPANLVAAVITQESGGDPQAVSYSGAVGLMQVMPRDGLAASFLCESGPYFSNRPTSDELLDPNFNIEYGAQMLAGLIEKYGDMREALRAYGPYDVGYSYADLVIGIYQSNP